MDALESPLEALALNYLTYGFLTAVNNIWAWVAVITAAVSFWRIRASSSTPELIFRSHDATSTSSAPPNIMTESAAAQTASVSSTPSHEELILSAPIKTSSRMLERQGSTKMKFSLYYKEDSGEDDGGGERGDVGVGAAVMTQKMWFNDWESMMEMRMGDMGWYRWQDRTVLDGSVVRLWEGLKRREAAVAALAW